MYADPTGHFPWLIVIILAVGVIAGGLLGGFSNTKLLATTEEGYQLTVWDRVRNIFIGTLGGAIVSGAIIALSGVGGGLAVGASTVAAGMSITFLQMFVIGALIYNTAAILLSIFGVEAPMIEYESQNSVSHPKMKK